VSQFLQSAAGNRANLIVDDIVPLPFIKGDSEALSLALINLIDNAIKYSPENAPVRIKAEESGGRVLIHVRDQGIGIHHEDRKYIFERFYRGRDAAVRKVRGTGLGLSLVKDIVSNHQGEIHVETIPGNGSTFTLSFPAVTAVKEGASS
jgi:signal transduction histidine kinase